MRVLLMATGLVAAGFLAGCGGGETRSGPAEEKTAEVTLADIAASEIRSADNKARDKFRHPVETLTFFELTPGQTVVEIWPGGGWYTEVIAPYLATGDGTYYAAGFDPDGASERGLARINAFNEAFTGKPETYGTVKVTAFSAKSGPIAPAGSADLVLSFRNVHNWMGGGFADKAFSDFYEALTPGGLLGVVEHRTSAEEEQDPEARSGYVRQDYVIALAEKAGFEFVEASEVNANPADTADHPFGVWTLPPVARTSPFRQEPDPTFDRAKYDAIGESDRMTLKFRKPLTADGALLE